MVGIYVSLARDLQRQMEIAEPASQEVLGDGFEEFLEVAEDADELNILNWVAETYRGMGEAFVRRPDQALPKQADGYFEKAGQRVSEDPRPRQKRARFRHAVDGHADSPATRQDAGGPGCEYKEAMDIFEDLLKANPAMLPVQVEAARTYQDWGGRPGPGMEQNYVRAMVGARPDKTARQVRNVT